MPLVTTVVGNIIGGTCYQHGFTAFATGSIASMVTGSALGESVCDPALLSAISALLAHRTSQPHSPIYVERKVGGIPPLLPTRVSPFAKI